ncbi:MAG TPA: DUF4142 domain-containing protein [Phycisphaerae bacterium]|nr:DUF4142 domain-containing protein [Phycisphaerae bacterium]
MRNRHVLAMALAVTILPFAAVRAADQGNDPQEEQKEFVHEAASGNNMEVQLGQYVAAHTQNAQTKQLAQTLVQDHTRSQEQLKQAAEKARVAFDDTLTPVHQAMLADLEKKSGKELDREFAFSAIADHHKDILEFSYASKNLPNAFLKQYASLSLPVLQKHLHMADALAQAIASVKDASAASER